MTKPANALPADEPAWLKFARADLGLREEPGRANAARVVSYFAEVGRPDVVHDSVAWCAAAHFAWHARAGVAIPPPKKVLLARSALDWGTPLDAPRVGCTAVFPRGRERWQGHVGIVIAWSATHLSVLSGNQGDAVTISDFPRNTLLGLRWPPVEDAKGSAGDFRGAARKLVAGDIARAADALRCDEATIRALIDVEASGRGFGADRRPVIRFEPHVFRREIASGGDARKIAAARAAHFMPGGGISQAQRYASLTRASLIDEAAALRSASWGVGQVMGFNHAVCGFTDVQDFVRSMTDSEGVQLDAVVAFIVANGLDNALRARDWRAFARGYNGPGYAAHLYDEKLSTAWARHSRRKDAIGPATILRMGDAGDAVAALQRALDIEADGDFGSLTRDAVRAIQSAHGLTPDGEAGPETLSALDLIPPPSSEETTNMNTTKSPFESLGITGPALGFIVWALNRVIGESVLSGGDVTMAIDALSVLWTAATAIWGRWRATKIVALRG